MARASGPSHTSLSWLWSGFDGLHDCCMDLIYAHDCPCQDMQHRKLEKCQSARLPSRTHHGLGALWPFTAGDCNHCFRALQTRQRCGNKIYRWVMMSQLSSNNSYSHPGVDRIWISTQETGHVWDWFIFYSLQDGCISDCNWSETNDLQSIGWSIAQQSNWSLDLAGGRRIQRWDQQASSSEMPYGSGWLVSELFLESAGPGQ